LNVLSFSSVTTNTRTQNKALLALGAVATLYPNLVLRHVMPVFTFMGASTIRHDDNYTFTVMQKVEPSQFTAT